MTCTVMRIIFDDRKYLYCAGASYSETGALSAEALLIQKPEFQTILVSVRPSGGVCPKKNEKIAEAFGELTKERA